MARVDIENLGVCTIMTDRGWARARILASRARVASVPMRQVTASVPARR
jgi:hypothetical protein